MQSYSPLSRTPIEERNRFPTAILFYHNIYVFYVEIIVQTILVDFTICHFQLQSKGWIFLYFLEKMVVHYKISTVHDMDEKIGPS